MAASPIDRAVFDPTGGARDDEPGRLSLVVASDGAHPRMVRVRVDDETVGDLFFRSEGHRAHFVSALVARVGATLEREPDLLIPYDAALFEAPPGDPGRDGTPGTEGRPLP